MILVQGESEGPCEACSSWHSSTATITHGTTYRSGCHVAMVNDDIRHRASERVPFPSDLSPSGVTLIGLKLGIPFLRRTINGPECPGAWKHDVLEVQQRVIDGTTRLASTAYLLYSCL